MTETRHVRIKREVLKKFKKFVVDKREKLRGCLQEEATKALDFYMSHSSVKSKQLNPSVKTRDVYKEVSNYLRRRWGIHYQTPLSKLKESIRKLRGRGGSACDRTVRRWFNRFKNEGLIKNVGLNQWELVL